MPSFLRPTAEFDKVTLDLVQVAPQTRYMRIFLRRHLDPLGFGKTASRFSDPRRRPDHERFGVLYLGSTLEVCFLEAVLRDQRNGAVGRYPMQETELTGRVYAELEVQRPLNLVDMRNDGRIRMGIPSDVANASDQRPARAWSLALHRHPQCPDGIIYPSRLNGHTNIAVYGRAADKLAVVSQAPLLSAAGFAAVLDSYLIAII